MKEYSYYLSTDIENGTEDVYINGNKLNYLPIGYNKMSDSEQSRWARNERNNLEK